MGEKELGAGDFVTNGVRLLRPLAEGGMGRVWIAEHLGLKTEVVVKLMAKEMVARPDGATRFAREAAIAAAIKSPHVVQVFDHGIAPEHNVPYIVMERLEGKDLGAVLDERGRLEPNEAAAVIVQIGKALAKAHKAAIIHRDIKPENIFLCAPEPEGEGTMLAKLLDFGTAKRDERTTIDRAATLPGEIMGTPYYMSPEQSVGAMLDERTDIWSLGVVAFEALTGRRPFEGTNVGAIALAIHGPLPRMSDRVEDLPPALDAWFAKACAQVPQDRFATVREMTSAFVEALTGAAPAVEQTESICLPPRRISVRPQAAPDDMQKTLPTSIEPSIPPPAMLAATTRPPAMMDSMSPLAASLPNPATSQRPAKIAAGLVALVAAFAMAAIVMNRPVAAPATHTAAAEPPPAAVPDPGPTARQDVPPPPVDVPATPPAPAAHKKTAKAPAAATKKGAHPAPKKDDDEDLTRLIKAGADESPARLAPTAAPVAPTAASVAPTAASVAPTAAPVAPTPPLPEKPAVPELTPPISPPAAN